MMGGHLFDPEATSPASFARAIRRAHSRMEPKELLLVVETEDSFGVSAPEAEELLLFDRVEPMVGEFALPGFGSGS